MFEATIEFPVSGKYKCICYFDQRVSENTTGRVIDKLAAIDGVEVKKRSIGYEISYKGYLKNNLVKHWVFPNTPEGFLGKLCKTFWDNGFSFKVESQQ